MKAPFRYLVYREALLSQKHISSAVLSSLCIAAVFLLTNLSIKCGNLADSFADSNMKSGFAIGLNYIPCVCCCTILTCMGEATHIELGSAWRKFRLSTPVSPWKFSLAKYTYIAIITIAVILFSIGYKALCNYISGVGFGVEEISAILCITALFLAFTTVMQILLFVFGSIEKAGIATAILILVLGRIIYRNNQTIDRFVNIFDKTEELLAFMPLVFIAIFGIGFAATALFLKRRER